MKRYSNYKDSGVDWLNEIPTHWEVKPIKRFVHINGNLLPENTNPDYELAYIDISNVDKNGLIEPPTKMKFQDAPSRARRKLKKGDTIISTVRTYLKAVAFINSEDENLVASTGFAALTPLEKVVPQYLSHAVKSSYFISNVTANSTGINYPAISEYRFGWLKLAMPPREEQDAIVSFLEAKEAQINKFIANKRRIIELLKEQKAALINRAVTRGLNPEAPMKPSGDKWVGAIPAHWQVLRNKFLFREINERSVTGEETKLSMTQKFGLIPTSDMEERSTQAESFEGYKICEVNDLVLNKLKAHLGVFAIAKQRGLVSPDYTVFRPVRSLNLSFFDYLFHTRPYVARFKNESSGIVEGFLRLYTDDFNRIGALFPPIEEQNIIVEYIEKESLKVSRAIEKAEREIALIEEYRASLIDAAVTGKVDVRREAASAVEI